MADSASFCFEEDSEEVLPKEFKDAKVLTLSEVSKQLEERRKLNEQFEDEQPLSEVFEKSRSYCTRFGKFKNQTALDVVIELVDTKSDVLNKYERVTLVNLCPVSVDEAKALIPSLDVKIHDEELKELLDAIHTILNYQ